MSLRERAEVQEMPWEVAGIYLCLASRSYIITPSATPQGKGMCPFSLGKKFRARRSGQFWDILGSPPGWHLNQTCRKIVIFWVD